MLKSLGAGLVFKIGLGIAAAALAGGSGVLVYAWMTPPSTDGVATDPVKIDSLEDSTSRLVAAAGAAQDDYRAACEKRIKEFGSELDDALHRITAEYPDLASSAPSVGDGSPESACTIDWRAFVHDVCTTAIEDRPEPSAEVLEALPEGLRPLVSDPCNAEWSKVDWGKAMADFDPGALMKSACTAVDKRKGEENGEDTSDVEGAGSAGVETDNRVEIEGDVPTIGGTFDLSMNSLGIERLCERDLDFSAVTDFLHELDWESLLDGTAPTKEEIDQFRERLRGTDDSSTGDGTPAA